MRQILIFDNAADVARAAADRCVEIAHAAIDERGRLSIALAGGSTPKRAYELLASDDYKAQLDWSKVHIFFGDERCVPPDDAESNYRMANEALLSRVAIPPQNIHRMQGVGDAVANARLYEDELRAFFNDAEWPRFDLILLGMGDDGHTASLFPNSAALNEQQAWVAANWVEKFGVYRITLSLPAINHAAHIAFLVTGENKAERLAEVLGEAQSDEPLPSQLIHPLDGSLEWLIDKAAARKIVKSE
ncbi:MAG: 6-phosphogluconolactonase [Acidobacteriota bacterium]|jgi:6-phosphogluconolactonase|nr:6-phosphogluconolactonase [Acidobacteriota bacterium]